MYLHDYTPSLVSLVTLRHIWAAVVGLGITFSKSVQKGQKHIFLHWIGGCSWPFVVCCTFFFVFVPVMLGLGFGAQNPN
jgi:dolichyl-phosphate-mannose--protein O-mannosyl transferase